MNFYGYQQNKRHYYFSGNDWTDVYKRQDYEYITDIRENEKSKFIKRYDLLSPCHAILEEKPRYIKLTKDNKESYVSYLTISSVVSDLEFPSSEIFYYQQEHFNFPIDTSMNVEILENKKALSKVRNCLLYTSINISSKKELKVGVM